MTAVETLLEINGIATEDLEKVISPEGYIASDREANFGAFFGRDAAICSIFQIETYKLQKLEELAVLKPVKDSLVTMAVNQGQVVNEWRDEEPGKIVHELRDSSTEKNRQWLKNLEANNWPVEGGRLRGFESADSTPLFVWAGCDYLLLTKDQSFFKWLDPHIRRAIEWMEKYGDVDDDGYIEFEAKNKNTLINQGWKDSSDSIKTATGERPPGPIALVEIQGYKYRALMKAADLYSDKEVCGEDLFDPAYADQLRTRAKELRENFNRDFWMNDKEFFAYALGGNKKQVTDITSNVGHLLITGIIERKKVPRVVNRLMQPDILSGGGIRTLSLNSPNFSDEEPSAYHLGGSVWPHDNGIIALGMEKLGYIQEAEIIRDRVIRSQVLLKRKYNIRNPELFMVDRYGHLRPYETAQQPQSWAIRSNLYWTAAISR